MSSMNYGKKLKNNKGVSMYKKIINKISIFAILVLLISCGDDSSSSSDLWSTSIGREYETNFMDGCTSGEYGWDDYCQCGLDWIKRNYPNPANADDAVNDSYWISYVMDVCLDKLPY